VKVGRSAGQVGVIVAAVLAAACGPGSRHPKDPRRDVRAAASMVGEWRWVQLIEDPGLRRTEDERWQFVPTKTGAVIGRYQREVTVQSTDGTPFACNQALEYRQRAVFDVEVAAGEDGAVVKETKYRVEPSPCDHGFRKLGEYVATVGEQQVVLRWGIGEATLLRTGPPPAALAEPAWPGDDPNMLGAWAWSATWREPRGPTRTSTEAWEIANGPDGTLDVTVLRTTDTIDPDGETIACAGADRWTATERVAIEGRAEGDLIRLREVAVEATPHPCTAMSPHRVLDDATMEQIGDFLVLAWRGDRRQVLSRPAR
jgi:hypothetical protein